MFTREDVENDVLAAMREAGLRPKLPLLMNGERQRCPVEGRPRGNDGAYCIYLDNWPAGWFQNHVGAQPVVTWKYKGKALTPEEKARFHREMEESRAAREKERKATYAKAAAAVREMEKNLSHAPADHPYLARKKVAPLGDLALYGDALIMRLRDETGQPWTYESIAPDGTKRFLKGGKKRGNWFTIPAAKGKENAPIVIVEGYATGASIHMATGFPIAVASDCGNLLPTARCLRKMYPDRELLFGADNDIGTPNNPGAQCAKAAAKATGGRVILPEPTNHQNQNIDWNDVHVELGLEAVKNSFIPEMHKQQTQQPPISDDEIPPPTDADAPLSTDADTPTEDTLLPDDIAELTDVFNAKLLIKLHGEDIRYCPEWRGNGWLVWNGQRWLEGAAHQVTQMAISTIETLKTERDKLTSADDKRAFDAHIKWSSRAAGLEATLKIARTFPEVNISPRQLNAKPFLLNTPKGKLSTLDLEHMKMRRPRREDYLTRMIDIPYSPDAKCPQWLAFLDTITCGDKELADYLQRAVGYSITGSTKEQVMFHLYGSGRNGKTTFLDTIHALLGTYARQASMDTFIVKRFGNSSDDLANLQGARFVVASESEENARLHESLVKQITGGGVISARRLYENWFEYNPEFKVWLDTNHMPTIKGTDFGIWRRMRVIPFNATIEDAQVDLNLPEKLKAELPGILAWAVQGCAKWGKYGLGMPAAVKKATGQYRTAMDTVGVFLSECTLEGDGVGFEISAADLYKLYEQWAEENGEHSKMPKRHLGLKLKERGYRSERRHSGRFWMGLMEKPLDYDEEQEDGDYVIF